MAGLLTCPAEVNVTSIPVAKRKRCSHFDWLLTVALIELEYREKLSSHRPLNNMAAPMRLPLLTLSKKWLKLSGLQRAVHSEAVTQEAAYPPVIPSYTAKSKSAKKLRETVYHDRVRNATSSSEKVELLTKVQRKKYVVYPQTSALNADRWYQHFTKTVFLKGLPEKFSSPCDQSVLSKIKSVVVNGILQERFYVKKKSPFLQSEQKHFVRPFMTNLVLGATSALGAENPQLSLSRVDFDPQVNFYWMRGETTVPRGHRRGRVDPIRFQIDDQPHSQIRIPQQLEEFCPLESHASDEVPVITLGPDRLPLFTRQYDNRIFTGSKVMDPCCYGHTQFHITGGRFKRSEFKQANAEDQIEVHLRANAISSLFAWTGAQAMFQGFWSKEDVTRPFVSQAVITDGQHFSFFCYQLNTLALTVETDKNNPRKNICWGTESMCLYEELRDGELVGLNENVLALLTNFLLNRSNTQ
ncbi:39S ribosomal protein S30, mitochondrial [Polypterus senegalus]|uniref:39S ribosomal protein S30, mitochondrial n=1 Tax=Polypterus senegalus TaxID=55291 RepID=UPI00196571B1|nr:39S ribosomal protein S30, mitochondrial [Polypterus senegalus]